MEKKNVQMAPADVKKHVMKLTENHRRSIDKNDQKTLEKAVALSQNVMSEKEQAAAAKKAMTGFERTKILKQLETAIEGMQNDTDPDGFVAISRVRDTTIELCNPLLTQCGKLLEKQKLQQASIDEFKHQMNNLQTEWRRTQKALEIVNQNRADVLKQTNEIGIIREQCFNMDNIVKRQNNTLQDKIYELDSITDAAKYSKMQHESRIVALTENMDQMLKQQNDQIYENKKEIDLRLVKFQNQMTQLEQKLFQRDDQYNRLAGTVQKRMMTALDEMRKKHREDLEGLKKVEFKLKDMKKIVSLVETMEPIQKQMKTQLDNLMYLPQFIETSLPLLTTQHITDYMREILLDPTVNIEQRIRKYHQNQIKAILEQEKESRGQILKINYFIRRVKAIARTQEEKKIIVPWNFGAKGSFQHTLREDQLDKLDVQQMKDVRAEKQREEKCNKDEFKYKELHAQMTTLLKGKIKDSEMVNFYGHAPPNAQSEISEKDFKQAIAKAKDLVKKIGKEQLGRLEAVTRGWRVAAGHTDEILGIAVEREEVDKVNIDLQELKQSVKMIQTALQRCEKEVYSMKDNIGKVGSAPKSDAKKQKLSVRGKKSSMALEGESKQSELSSVEEADIAVEQTPAPKQKKKRKPAVNESYKEEESSLVDSSVGQAPVAHSQTQRQRQAEDNRQPAPSTNIQAPQPVERGRKSRQNKRPNVMPQPEQTISSPSPVNATRSQEASNLRSTVHQNLSATLPQEATEQLNFTQSRPQVSESYSPERASASDGPIQNEGSNQQFRRQSVRHTPVSISTLSQVLRPASPHLSIPVPEADEEQKISERPLSGRDLQPKAYETREEYVNQVPVSGQNPVQRQETEKAMVQQEIIETSQKNELIDQPNQLPEVVEAEKRRSTQKSLVKEVEEVDEEDSSHGDIRSDSELKQSSEEESSNTSKDSKELPSLNLFFMDQANNSQLRYLKREVKRAKQEGKRKVAEVKKGVNAMINLLPKDQEDLVDQMRDLLALEKYSVHCETAELPDANYTDPIDDKDRVQNIYYKNALIKRHATERPCMERSLAFDENQVDAIQRLLDDTVDWAMLQQKLRYQTLFQDMRSRFASLHKEYKDGNADSLARLYRMEQKIDESTSEMAEMRERLSVEIKAIQKFKSRIAADAQIENNKINHKMEKVKNEVDRKLVALDGMKRISQQLLHAAQVDALLTTQDAQDKRYLHMLQLKAPEATDGKDLKPNHPESTIQQVRQACFAYSAMPVKYRDFELSQHVIRNVRDQILIDAQGVYDTQVLQQAKESNLDETYAPRHASDVTVRSYSTYDEVPLSEQFELMKVLPRKPIEDGLTQSKMVVLNENHELVINRPQRKRKNRSIAFNRNGGYDTTITKRSDYLLTNLKQAVDNEENSVAMYEGSLAQQHKAKKEIQELDMAAYALQKYQSKLSGSKIKSGSHRLGGHESALLIRSLEQQRLSSGSPYRIERSTKRIDSGITSNSRLISARNSVKAEVRNLTSHAPSESRAVEALDPIWLPQPNRDLPNVQGSSLFKRSLEEPQVDVVDQIIKQQRNATNRSRYNMTRSALYTIDQVPSAGSDGDSNAIKQIKIRSSGRGSKPQLNQDQRSEYEEISPLNQGLRPQTNLLPSRFLHQSVDYQIEKERRLMTQHGKRLSIFNYPESEETEKRHHSTFSATQSRITGLRKGSVVPSTKGSVQVKVKVSQGQTLQSRKLEAKRGSI